MPPTPGPQTDREHPLVRPNPPRTPSEPPESDQAADRDNGSLPSVVTVTTNVDWNRVLWLGGALALLVLSVWVLAQVPAVSVPLMLAMGIAYVLHPVVDRMASWGIGRTWAIVVLVGSAVAVLVVSGILLIPVLIDQMRRFPQGLRDRFQEVSPWLEQTLGVHLPETVGATGHLLADELSHLNTRMDQVFGQSPSLGEIISGGTSSVLTALIGLMLVPVLAVYFLKEYVRIRRWIENAIPRRYHEAVVTQMRAVDRALGGFVRGQGVVALILAVLYAIGFHLVGLPLALLVAVVSGLGNYVPYVGTAFGILLASVIMLVDGQTWLDALLVYAVFAVVQFIEGWFITPKVVGDRVGLSPVPVIFFVLLFGELFGFIGVLIAVPVTAVLKILLRSLFQVYLESEMHG